MWVLTGARSSPTAGFPTLPSSVFSSVELAEEWIKCHGLSATLTLYRVDTGAYDWAVGNGYFKPSKPHHETAEFVGQFSGGDLHYHHESGVRTDLARQ